MNRLFPINFTELTGIPICSYKIEPIVCGIVRYDRIYELICLNGYDLSEIWSTTLNTVHTSSTLYMLGNSFRCFGRSRFINTGGSLRNFVLRRGDYTPISKLVHCGIIGCTGMKDAEKLRMGAISRIEKYTGGLSKRSYIDNLGEVSLCETFTSLYDML